MSNVIAFDSETFFSRRLNYSIKNTIAEWYCRHDLFDCYQISVSDGKQAWAGHPKNFNWSSIDGATLVSHNSYFDRTVYAELVRRGLAPQLTFKAWHCTANLTSYLCNRRALAHAIEYLYKVKLSKAVREDSDNKRWPQDFSQEQQAAMLEYGRSDALWCWRLWNDFSDKWPDREKRLSNLTIDQGMRGVQIDTALLDQYLIQSHEMKINTEKLLPWLDEAYEDDWDEFNTKPTSTKCIAEQCRRSGIPCPPTKSHFDDGEEMYAEWEATYVKLNPWIAALSSWRSINKLYKSFQTVKSRLRSDGTMPFGLKYFGAHCFTGDHEVLAPTGWERLDKWSGGPIMQWSGDSLCFESATANKFDATGENLLKIKSGHIDCVLTPGHWMATFDCKTGEQRKEQAGNIVNKRRKIPISGMFSGGSVSLPDWKIKLFAAVQADGHYLTDCRSIRFRLVKPRKIARLKSILSGSGLDWKEDRFPSEPKVSVIVIRRFPEWLENRKQWTSELLTWTKECLMTLCDELVHWDGTQCGPNSVCYVTVNENNASWISTIAHLTGKAATITKRNNRESGWSDSYNVFIRPSQVTEIRAKNWFEGPKADEVFCPTAKFGACLFRHNGTIFITHQTGRWSGDAGLNMQNMRKKPIYCNERGLMETDEKREPGDWVRHAIDFRHLIIPRPGKKMIVSDLAQIEPRCLAWLAGDEKALEYVRAGKSIYEAEARFSMGFTGDKLDKSSIIYAEAKARRLALGYGAGWEKFIIMAQDYTGMDLTADDPEFVIDVEGKHVNGYGKRSREIVAAYRKENTLIADKERGIWARLELAFKRSIGDDFKVVLPNGRVLRYSKVKCERRLKPDRDGKPKLTTVFTMEIGGRRFETYGGKLTENVTQAFSRDVFAEYLLDLHDSPGIDVLFSSHDEGILEVDQHITATDVEHVMSRCPDWCPGLPVAAEAKEVPHYLK